MHHDELIEVYHDVYGKAKESTIRTRCSELVTKGLVRDSGKRVLLPTSHRSAIVWEVVYR